VHDARQGAGDAQKEMHTWHLFLFFFTSLLNRKIFEEKFRVFGLAAWDW